MPQNGLTVGSDARFDVITAAGALSLPTLESFHAKKITQQRKVNPLNASPINMQFPNGWEGSFVVARADSTLDDYFAAQEAAQYAGANLAAGTIHQTITEVNGTTSQYMFTDVQLSIEDAGNYEALSEVKQHVSFVASARIKVV